MKKESEIKLEHAEIFFKFVLGIRAHMHTLDKPLEYLGIFSFGKHVLNQKDLELNKKQEEIGASILEHVGTYIMIQQLYKVLEDEWGNQSIRSHDEEVRSIFQVVRYIRHAFAHDPFNPKWRIDTADRNQVYAVSNILTLKTHALHGKRVNRLDYGGPLALLRLLQYTRKKLESHL